MLSCIPYLIAVKSRNNSASRDCKFQVNKSLVFLDENHPLFKFVSLYLALNYLVSQEVSVAASKCATRSCNPIDIEESTSSYKSRSPNIGTQNSKLFRSSSIDEPIIASGFAASGSKRDTDVSGNLSHKHYDFDPKLHTSGDKRDVSVAPIVCIQIGVYDCNMSCFANI